MHQHYQAAGRNDDAIKVGVAYQLFAGTRVSAIYEHLHYRTDTGDLQRNGYYASLVQQPRPGSVRIGFAYAANGTGSSTDTVGFFRSGSGTGATQVTVGYDYPLSKRTALFAWYSRINNMPERGLRLRHQRAWRQRGGRSADLCPGHAPLVLKRCKTYLGMSPPARVAARLPCGTGADNTTV